MKNVFRAIYAKSPNSVRLAMGRNWKIRGALDRMMIHERMMEDRLAATRIFFILGSGRCGTMFLSRLLNKAPDALVLHEPLRHSDLEVRPACRKNPQAATEYVRKFRRYEIFKKIREHDVGTYGEVSQPLRCLGAALKEVIPTATMMILVRDGRAVIRSALNRQKGKGRWNHPMMMPLAGDPYRDRWESMNDFQKACWWWMDSYQELMRHLPGVPVLHFERILSDYDYLQSNVLGPLGIPISKRQYEEHKADKTQNSAIAYTVPHWNEWSDEQARHFAEICGPTMQALGYHEFRYADEAATSSV